MPKISKIEPTVPAIKQLKKVAAYARVSMQSERMMHSLSAQISYYSKLIQKNPDWEYAGVYADDFISGTNTVKRDEFKRMLADCEEGKIDIILTKSISRFARNTVDLLETVRHLKAKGIEVRFEKENINSMSGDGELMLSILASFAQEESRSISENIRWATKKRFEKGIPTAINGTKMKVSDIIRELNRLGGKHGIGIIDIVENRVVGMKSRGVYETPGGTILMEAHKQLEELTLDRETLAYKKLVATKFADLVYEGKWFCPLRESLQAFVEKTQETVTGQVKMRLYKGNIIKAGTTSPYSLYSESLASFTTGELYDHKDATGFINLFGLSMKVRAMMNEKNKNNDK